MPAGQVLATDALAADALHTHAPLEAWPTSDLPPAAAVDRSQLAESWPAAEPLADQVASPADGVLASDGFVYDTPRIDEDELQPEPVAAEAEAEPVAAEVEPEPVVAFEPEPEPVAAEVEPEPVLAFEPEPEPVAAEVEPEPVVAFEPEPEPEPVAAEVEPEPEPVAAEVEPEPEVVAPPPLRILSWEPDGAYDVEVAAALGLQEPVVAEVEPEPVVAEVEPEPVVAEVEPEPVVAEVEAEPEPVAAFEAEPEPERRTPLAPISHTILRFPEKQAAPPPAAPLAAQDDSPELAARRAQLEGLGLGDPGTGPVMPEPPAILPYRARGAAVPQGEIAARAVAQGVSFWEASAREVASATALVGVQNCGGCGLSLSASARFCRRCGTPQAQSA
jgi:hypothetical protein